MKKILCLLLCICTFTASYGAGEKYKAVVVTGQNNHNWPVSSVAIQKILENSGLFTVDIATSPTRNEPMDNFNVDFTSYDVVVVDYNGDYWSEKMQKGFVDYVNNGGGVIFYHAANAAFPQWEEYNKIAGFGGWGERNEKSGPLIYIEDNKVVYDQETPGMAGNHGPQHEFVMNMIKKHPITKGLPSKWMHAKDELYSMMRGPGKIKSPLYYAHSPKDKHGTDRDELMIFTVNYGKARIFHMTIGHCGRSLDNNPSMQCTGFQVCLQRGAEWAASGKVTQPVPDDFPTAEKVSYRLNYK